MSLFDLMYGNVCSSIPAYIRADLIAEKVAEVTAIEGELADLRDRVDELEECEGELKRAEDQIEDLKKDLADANERIDKLGDKISELKDNRDDLDGQLDAAKRELDVLRSTAADDAIDCADDRAAGGPHANALRALVAAFDDLKLGKTARVGALVVVLPAGDLAAALGEALTNARALL